MKLKSAMLKGFVLALIAFKPLALMAVDLPLSDMPLALRTQSAMPNVLFLYDDSGSMSLKDSGNDVFYAPGYDSDYEYRCSTGTELVADNSKTVTIYVSDRNGSRGTPYFTFGTDTYGWGGSGNADDAAGTSAARVCFAPNADFIVRFKDYGTKPKTTCPNGYNLNTVSGMKECRDTDAKPKDTWECPSGYTYDNYSGTNRCYKNSDLIDRPSKSNCATGYTRITDSTRTKACGLLSSRVNLDFIPGKCPAGFEELGTTQCTRTTDLQTPYFEPSSTTTTVTGNFLNWYLSKTESRLSSNVLLPGYASYQATSPWTQLSNDNAAGVPWTQTPADNFVMTQSSSFIRFQVYADQDLDEFSSISDLGMKNNVSFKWDRMAVAKDVGKLLVRKVENVNIALASFHTQGDGDKKRDDDGWLMHALTSFEIKEDDPTTTDDDEAVADTLAATQANKASVISVLSKMKAGGGTPTSQSMVRMARYLFQGWESAEFNYFNKVDAKTPPAVQTTPRSTTKKKISDILKLSHTDRTADAVGYDSAKKNLTQGAWCQKTAMAVLTDGQPSTDSNYADGGLLSSYDTIGTVNEDYTTKSDYKGIIRVPGALFDHDWLPTDIRGHQNIESFFIAFGSASVISDDVFTHAGNAAGGGSNNSYAATDGGAVLEAFKAIIEKVTADSLSVTAIAVSSVSELKTENYAFQATYDTEYFTSDLKALNVNEKGEFIQPDGTGASRLSTGIKPEWNAADVLNRMYITDDASVSGVTPNPNANYLLPRNRLVYTWDGSAGVRFGSSLMARPTSAGAAFAEFNALPTSLQNDISATAGTDSRERYDLMMYLLGDVSNEVYHPSTDTLDNEKYRKRGSYNDTDNDDVIDAVTQGGVLGDIVNSSPQYQKIPSSQWNDLNFGSPSEPYSKYKALHVDRPAVVYVGSNSGFLHAFTVEAATKSAEVNSATKSNRSFLPGAEIFAYLPSMVASSAAKQGLHNLADPYFDHRFYVDLTPTISDVYVDFYASGAPDPEWRSVLVGGLGKGGKGYFALDVTCPLRDTSSHTPPGEATAVQNTCADEDFGPENVLWEFDSSDDSDMGFSYSEPIIAKINYNAGITNDPNRDNGGRWAVITGNGYNSANGRAALYILFLDGGLDGTWTEGVDYLKIKVSDATTDKTSSKNGLSSPTAIDIDYDGLIDRVYAGDLKGQMWSFDISAAATKTQFASNSIPWVANKLFTTGSDSSTRQPITTAPSVARDMSYGRTLPKTNPDLMVIFGTGQYLTVPDIYDTKLQTIYAVHDRGTYNLTRYDTVSVGGTPYPKLEPRIFKEVVLSAEQGGLNRTIHGDPLIPEQFGWYVELASDSDDSDTIDAAEEKGERLVFRSILIGKLFVAKSIIPNPGSCAGATQSWTMTIDWTTGSAFKEATYDANLDGKIDSKDLHYVGQFNESGGSALGRGGNNLFDSIGSDARSRSYNFGNVTLSERIGWEEKLPFGFRAE